MLWVNLISEVTISVRALLIYLASERCQYRICLLALAYSERKISCGLSDGTSYLHLLNHSLLGSSKAHATFLAHEIGVDDETALADRSGNSQPSPRFTYLDIESWVVAAHCFRATQRRLQRPMQC